MWDYNRNHILERYPQVDTDKVVVARLGVDVFEVTVPPLSTPENNDAFTLLAVGRLHAVKDHAFLVRVCA